MPGITRRLFRISSDSVRIKKVPISIIHFAAGNPKGMPQAARRSRMNAAFGKGFGAARLIAPRMSSRSMIHWTA